MPFRFLPQLAQLPGVPTRDTRCPGAALVAHDEPADTVILGVNFCHGLTVGQRPSPRHPRRLGDQCRLPDRLSSDSYLRSTAHESAGLLRADQTAYRPPGRPGFLISAGSYAAVSGITPSTKTGPASPRLRRGRRNPPICQHGGERAGQARPLPGVSVYS